MSGDLEIKKGGQLVEECTVFNSDIRGFTRMSDGAHPAGIVDMLNEYFELMVETVFKYEGTLDKFMGDGIMALWGAPVLHPDDALRSVSCGLEQMEVLAKFNRRRAEENEPGLAIGIGIHTGPVVAGYIGSSKALSYTVIGDVANTSARLCGIATPGQLLISEATLAKLKEAAGDLREAVQLMKSAAGLAEPETARRLSFDVARLAEGSLDDLALGEHQRACVDPELLGYHELEQQLAAHVAEVRDRCGQPGP